MSYGVVTHGTSFAYYRCLLHVFLNSVSQSDTDSGVRFALTLSVQKLADRRIVSEYLCAAVPMVESLMDSSHVHLHIVATSWHIIIVILSFYVHV